MSNGTMYKRTERERLCGKPLTLFTLDLQDGAKEVKAPLLPASAAMEWGGKVDDALNEMAEHGPRSDEIQADIDALKKKARELATGGPMAESAKIRAEILVLEDMLKVLFRESKTKFWERVPKLITAYGEAYADAVDADNNPLAQDYMKYATVEQLTQALMRLKYANDPFLQIQDASLEMARSKLK